MQRRIVIMGASSGIGCEVARQFIDMGWIVGVAGRRVEPLEELRKCSEARIFTACIDVCNPSAHQDLLALVERMGGVDIYLHSSGIGKQNIELDANIEIETLRTNGEGFVRMIGAMFRYFRDRGIRGDIAAITSVAGTRGTAAAPSYSATKALQSNYLTAMQQLSNRERLGIRIMDIRPGFISTPLLGESPSYPMIMGLNYASRKITRSILKGRRRVVIDWRYSILVFVWRLIPNFIWERMRL